MTTLNTRQVNGVARQRARPWTSRERSWEAHTRRFVSVTWDDVEAALLPALGANGLQALLNAPSRMDAFLRSRNNVVPLFAVARRGTQT